MLRLRCCLTIMLALAAVRAAAFDVGDPTFRGLNAGPRVRFEVFGDWTNRSTRLEYDRPLLGTPAGGPDRIGPTPAIVHGRLKANQVVTRWAFYPLEVFSFQFDAGFSSDVNSDETVVALGGAGKVLLTESGPFQLSAQFGANFVPEFTTRESGTLGAMGPYTAQGDFDAYEYGAALLGSMTADCGERCRLMVYGGPRLTAYRGEHRSQADFSDTGERMWVAGISKQESLLGLAVGSRLDWGEHWSARIEGRILEEQSVSLGIGAAY